MADVHVRLLCSCYLDQVITHARRCCALLAIKQKSYGSLRRSMRFESTEVELGTKWTGSAERVGGWARIGFVDAEAGWH